MSLMLRVLGCCAVLVAIAYTATATMHESSPASRLRAESSLSQRPPQPARLSALGTLVPRGRVRHIAASSTASRLERLLVEEGSRVTQGQLLAYTDEHDWRSAELAHAQAQVAIAQSKLNRLLAGPDPSEVQALSASLTSQLQTSQQRERELERARGLAKTSSISASELEDYQLNLAIAQNAVAETKARLQLLKCVREEDVRVLRSELVAAERQVEIAQQHLARTQIVAPCDGTILRIHTRPGERPGESGVLEMGDIQHMQVIAEVYEADAPTLQPGATARVRLKSGGRELRGHVVHIRPIVGRKIVLDNDPVSDSDARVVEAIIDLEEQGSDEVRSLSNARVEVIIENKP